MFSSHSRHYVCRTSPDCLCINLKQTHQTSLQRILEASEEGRKEGKDGQVRKGFNCQMLGLGMVSFSSSQ